MSSDLANLFAPLVMFAIAAAITPGPNNIMLTASGANYGFVRTVPHMLGIVAGFCLLLLAISAGLGILFERYPGVQTALKIAGSIYLCYFAWRIATARSNNSEADGSKPFSFCQAAGFQFINPKGWLMALSAMSAFTLSGDRYTASVSVLIFVFLCVTGISVAVWAGFGTAIGRWLKTPIRFRVFNVTMGMLTAGSIGLLFV
ncbi:MAG: LysE family translocator [Gammaproteobacteria bacterium]|nr:LysE family translocator [Gammaproteobacteria bacterium]MDH3468858.1 LysE family translocator [Gammaproteobacteria bacterium]